jgi:tetratricopeptide (TPR) repeat protein
MREAKAAADRAIAADNTLAEAHAAKGMVEALCYFDWTAAEASFECARALDPKLPLIDYWHSLAILLPHGKIGEASQRIGHAQKAEPASILLQYYRGVLQYLQGNYADAATILEVAVELAPEYESAHLILGDAYLFLRREQEAMRQYARVREIAVDSPSCWKAAEAYASAVRGRTSEAKRLLKRLVRPSGTGYSWPYEVAVVYAALGEADTAFEWLDRAREDGVPTLAWLRYDPKFSRLREHPKFAGFLARLGLGADSETSVITQAARA